MTIEGNGIYFFKHFTGLEFLAKNPTCLPLETCRGLGVPEGYWGVLNWWNVLENKFHQFYIQSDPEAIMEGSIVTEISYIHEGKHATLQRVTKAIYDSSIKKILNSTKNCIDDIETQKFLVNITSYNV